MQQDMHKDKPDSQQLARLKWQCRRGMLELDHMLMSYLDKCFLTATEHEVQVFEQLLSCPDQLLLEYLLGKTIPYDKEVANVATKIRISAGP